MEPRDTVNVEFCASYLYIFVQGIGSTGAVWHAVRTGGKGKDGAKGKDQVDQAAIKAYRIQQDDETDGRYLYNEVLRQLCVSWAALGVGCFNVYTTVSIGKTATSHRSHPHMHACEPFTWVSWSERLALTRKIPCAGSSSILTSFSSGA